MSFQGMSAHWWSPIVGDYTMRITRDVCWKCGRPNPDLAHMVNEYVAAVIGAELERRVMAAIDEHEAEHGCGHWLNCREAGAFIELLPRGLQPVLIG